MKVELNVIAATAVLALGEGQPVKDVPGALGVLLMSLVFLAIGCGAFFGSYAKIPGSGRSSDEREMKRRLRVFRIVGIGFIVGSGIIVLVALRLLFTLLF